MLSSPKISSQSNGESVPWIADFSSVLSLPSYPYVEYDGWIRLKLCLSFSTGKVTTRWHWVFPFSHVEDRDTWT